MKTKYPMLIAVALMAISGTVYAQAQKEPDVGVTVPNRVILIVKHGLIEGRATVASLGLTQPGSAARFRVEVGTIPSEHLNSNGKLDMRFQAFPVQVDKHAPTTWKIVQTSESPIPSSSFDSNVFMGNNVIELTPNATTDVDFQLKEDEYEGEPDFMLLIVGRAAFPTTGTESTAYEAGIIFGVDCP